MAGWYLEHEPCFVGLRVNIRTCHSCRVVQNPRVVVVPVLYGIFVPVVTAIIIVGDIKLYCLAGAIHFQITRGSCLNPVYALTLVFETRITELFPTAVLAIGFVRWMRQTDAGTVKVRGD